MFFLFNLKDSLFLLRIVFLSSLTCPVPVDSNRMWMWMMLEKVVILASFVQTKKDVYDNDIIVAFNCFIHGPNVMDG